MHQSAIVTILPPTNIVIMQRFYCRRQPLLYRLQIDLHFSQKGEAKHMTKSLNEGWILIISSLIEG